MTDILVVAELLGGELRKNTLSAIRFAADAASATGGAYDILVLGEGAANAAAEAAKHGARKVLKGEIAGGYVAEKLTPTIAEVAKSGGYGVVTAAASGCPGSFLAGVRDAAATHDTRHPSRHATAQASAGQAWERTGYSAPPFRAADTPPQRSSRAALTPESALPLGDTPRCRSTSDRVSRTTGRGPAASMNRSRPGRSRGLSYSTLGSQWGQ